LSWELSLAGLLVGVLVGMTGMGGGSLMTPILILLFNFNPSVAIGTDILHGAIFKSFGAWQHRVLGTVHARLACWMLLGSGPLSLVGVFVADALGETRTDTLQQLVGAALIVGGLGFLLKTYVRAHADVSGPFLLRPRDRLTAVAVGASCGFIVGLTSVGSGTFFGLAMLMLYPLAAQKIVGTDIFHAAALLWVAGVAHLAHGNVDLHAMGWLLVGSIPGVLIGARSSIHVPERALRVAFGIVLTLAGIKIVEAPYSTYVIAAAMGIALVVLLVWAVLRLRSRRVAPHDAT
jgi:uncharacterized membrane protein YfcA